MRSFIIMLLLVYLTACSAREKESKREVWQVITVSQENFPVKAGMIMTFEESSVTVTDKEQSLTFFFLKSKDRLVIKTDTARLLFKIEKTSDSAMTLHELYAPLPLNISCINFTNHKKHKK